MHLVLPQHPVAAIQAAVRRYGQANRSEIDPALDQWLGYGFERRTTLDQPEPVDPMVAPTGHQEVPNVLTRQTTRFVGDDSRWSLTRPGQHRQRPGNLAVPTRERMKPLATVPVTIAIIAPLDDVHQPARRQAVGIVVDAEQATEGVDTIGMRIPETGGDML